MSIWALADLHLALGVPEKAMDFFGEPWIGYVDKIQKNWKERITNEDLVLIAGDISWAMRPEEAVPDLEWIHQLPGTKVLIRGNHDYWWTSLSKVEKVLPPSLHLIQNNVFDWKDVSIAGARLWDSHEYQFGSYIQYQSNPRAKKLIDAETDPVETERIFQRELGRLETSLKGLNKQAKRRIAMTHYAPIGAELADSRVSKLLEKYQVDTCVFGHLHNVQQSIPLFGEKQGIRYLLTSCDYLNFVPIKLY